MLELDRAGYGNGLSYKYKACKYCEGQLLHNSLSVNYEFFLPTIILSGTIESMEVWCGFTGGFENMSQQDIRIHKRGSFGYDD